MAKMINMSTNDLLISILQERTKCDDGGEEIAILVVDNFSDDEVDRAFAGKGKQPKAIKAIVVDDQLCLVIQI